MITVIVSGGFDPVRLGHLNYIYGAEKLGDRLIIILNSDEFLLKKGEKLYPDIKERKEIMEAIAGIRFGVKALVITAVDEDMTVCKTLEMIRRTFPEDELIFANGGDRKDGNVPEKKICEELGVKMVFGVGGEKITSSSELKGRKI